MEYTKDRYMAPEVFKHRKYDKTVDVFSFAMILYQVIHVIIKVVIMVKRKYKNLTVMF